MLDSYMYQINVQWQDGRIGQMSSPELDQVILCATPPEFPHGVPGIWSPEHLFTAAVNSCFMTTFLAVAENYHLKYEFFSCKAYGKLSKESGKWMMSEVILKPELTICVDEQEAKALKILEKSEKACLITNSILSKVSISPIIKFSEVCV
ncbi:OsmC family protein [Lunatimonas lonarensis]|nr:OsmC family protein [Lunatimonas lonarensis]